MDEVLKRFFNSINYAPKVTSFKDSKLGSVILDGKKNTFEVTIINEKTIDIEEIIALFHAAKNGINGENKVDLKIINKQITGYCIESYLNFLIPQLVEQRPSLIGLKDTEINVKDKEINIEVSSKAEKDEFTKESKDILKKMESFGIPQLEFNIKINKKKEALVKEELKPKEENPPILKQTRKGNTFLGQHITDKITKVDDLSGEANNVAIEAYIFGIDALERENINIITLKISDKTNSMIAKIFRRDKTEFNEIMEHLEKDKWYRIKGSVNFDNYTKDYVFQITDMEHIDSPNEEIIDDAQEKRVELHLHTFMSAMDSVVNQDKIIKFARKLGHKALAITDHNCLQSFPDLYNACYYLNKDIEKDEDKFKMIYGVELNVVNDDIDLIMNLRDYNLLEDEFIVFDTETTGFKAGVDSMIEIGAVKVKNGEILDRFNELIDPKRKLPKRITEITGLADADLKDKDSEENVLKRFLEWVSDTPVIAHNAKFDLSFVKAAMDKYNLGEFNNTIIDTMVMARMLNPEWTSHKLTTMAKNYGIPWDEESHHRADYDSEATAGAFYKMAKILYDRNMETTITLDEGVDREKMIKFSYPFHVSILVQNEIGLKNLYRIISLAHTKYLHKNSEPKLPRHELVKYREGLLIGSGCINGEVFKDTKNMEDEEIINMMRFYDYIEVQPISAMSHLLNSDYRGQDNNFSSELELQNHIKKIVTLAKEAGKLVCATGDVHNLTTEDKKYREILVVQKTLGKLHPLYRSGNIVPDMKFLTTNEMLKEFSFLDEETVYEIVVTNTNKIAEQINFVEVIKKDLYVPKMPNADEETTKMVYDKAYELYGEVLPPLIVERLDKELNGIINNGYSGLYVIAQKLVKKSNEDGYFVGSRGTVGSSFVATMMGITEVNGLPAHYLCPDCKKTIFESDEGPLSDRYASGYDMPDLICECGTLTIKEGQDIPFSTFLGFDAEKVPDIDLNFSGDYQAIAHDYTRELFGKDNVFRAGTIGTVAQKTAFGYVKGYLEMLNITLRNAEIERLTLGCTGAKRTTGQHPGGIIVIPDYKDVFDFTAYQYPADDPNSSWYTTHFAFSAIEENVLKLDILGHDDPSMLKFLGDSTGIDILTLPFDDEKVLSLFSSPRALGLKPEDINCPTGTLGTPEFGTRLSIRMLDEVKPKTFSDLVKISGLSHGTDVWTGNARDIILNKVASFNEIICCRDDIMIYLMHIGIESKIAYKISETVRKQGKFLSVEDKQIMRDHGVPEWYLNSCDKIKYLFPKAHATAYVMCALRVAWFKVYRPLHYYAGYFSVRRSDFDIEAMLGGTEAIKARIIEIGNKGKEITKKDEDVADTLNVALEMCLRGYKFKNIDITKSEAKTFIIDEEDNSLIMPFITVDGLGDSVATKIIEEREERPFLSIEDFADRGKVNTTTIEKMKTLKVFEGLPETSQLSIFELV